MEASHQAFSGTLKQLADAARRGQQDWIELAIGAFGDDAHSRAINFCNLVKNEAADESFEINCAVHSSDYLEFHFHELDTLQGKVMGAQNDEVPRGMIRISIHRRDGHTH